MKAKEVGHKFKDDAVEEVSDSDKEGDKIFIHADEVLEMKDVQELDDLTKHELTETTDVEGAIDKEDEVTGWVRKRTPDENHDAQRPRNQIAENEDEAEVRQKLVDQGPENHRKETQSL